MLPKVLAIEPISTISPSAFSTTRNCNLRGVLGAKSVPPLLPKGPAAHIGIIVHSMLEKAGKGQIDCDSTFDYVWNECLEHEEKKMSSSWTEQHLSPLDDTFRYELKKQQCRLIVRKMYRTSSVRSSDGTTEEIKREVRLRTSDGRVSGRVDAIELQNGRVTIVDYKTGALNPPENSKQGVAPDEYAQQLKLYASLYYEENDKWPDELQIVGLSGRSISVPVQPEECMDLLHEAKTIISRVNCIMRGSSSGYRAIIGRLASPSPENCQFCRYRPACLPYWEAKDLSAEMGWPDDVCGTVASREVLGNGKLIIKLSSEASCPAKSYNQRD